MAQASYGLEEIFKQVHNSGIARIDLYKKYPESLKVVHLLPAVFTVGVVLVLLAAFICPWSLLLLALFAVVILQMLPCVIKVLKLEDCPSLLRLYN